MEACVFHLEEELLVFDVGDLFSILGGGAWLAKEAVLEICEDQDDLVRSKRIQDFVEENTDQELEGRFNEEILLPSNCEKIWETLELFKRDNPVWCKRHERKGWRGQYTGEYYEPVFGWQDIGHKRIPLFGRNGSPYGKTQREGDVLDDNRKSVLQMLMETHGKMLRNIALTRARKKYPLKKSNRSW